jgi:hypothetical protein
MNIIRKIIAPTKQHHEPYLTLWIADLEQGKQIWVQNSEDQEKPHWERYGELVERKILEKDEFMGEFFKDFEE